MIFFHFGNKNHPCFGAYHPANPARDRREGVLLCYPVGQEYLRAHRSFVALANRLSAAGYHTLRFDYFATGDSAGRTAEGRLHIWLENVAEAVRELQNSAEISQVSLVGMRLGALLAVKFAQKTPIRRLVLWDPVWKGGSYLQELQQQQRNWLEDLPFRPDFPDGQNGALEVLGYPMAPPLVAEIAAENLLQAEQFHLPPTLLIESAQCPETDEALSRLANPSACRRVTLPNSKVWQKSSDYNAVLIPNEALTKLMQWLQENP